MRTIFVFFILAFFISANGITVERNGRCFLAVNTHLFSAETDMHDAGNILAAVDRDLILIPVKNPSNPVFSVKNPSFLRPNRKIKLTIDGKKLNGKILSLNHVFFEIDIQFNRGDSGIAVFDAETNCIAGLLSHYVSGKQGKRFFAVRLDNLNDTVFECISASELLADIHIFNKIKQHEEFVIYTLINSQSEEVLKSALRKNMTDLEMYSNWKSTYLKNESEKSQNNIKQIYRRFFK